MNVDYLCLFIYDDNGYIDLFIYSIFQLIQMKSQRLFRRGFFITHRCIVIYG